MSDELTRGLPADLASVLRDQSVIVPQDTAVFELVAAWAKAPTPTASADPVVEVDMGLVSALYQQISPLTAASDTCAC
jgi:hypothetical protein